ncbi:tyrosine-type recombinase/integrase [Microbispora corallina]|uniref:tyrosine-type recombinase/integrase n=1 Tax=Microbispora corallina TaxID=83302 RepID=UPI003CD0A5C7
MAAVPARTGVTLAAAVRAFLDRPVLNEETVRSYGQTMTRLRRHLGDDVILTEVTADEIGAAFVAAWGTAAAATWNRHRAAVRSFAAWAAGPERGWAADDLAARLDRRPEPRGRTRPMGRRQVEALLERGEVPLRERTLWTLLYESAATAESVLALNVEDLDLSGRYGRVSARTADSAHRAGNDGNGGGVGERRVRWQSGAARLLPGLVAGRRQGPLFLADRRPGPARTPAAGDLCSHTGRGRLSYERAEYLFKRATRELDPEGNGYTLRLLRHSRLAHLGEDGWSAGMLRDLSGHESVRTLAPYVRSR